MPTTNPCPDCGQTEGHDAACRLCVPSPDRCPLCGEEPGLHAETMQACYDCGLPFGCWPRVSELVAIRDALLEAGRVMISNSTYDAYVSARSGCAELARRLAR